MALSGKLFNHHNDTWLWLLIWKEKFLNRNTAFFNPLLKTSIHCTFPCDAKAKNCQGCSQLCEYKSVKYHYEGCLQYALYFLLKQVLPQLFLFWIWPHLLSSPYPPVVTQLCVWDEQLPGSNFSRINPIPTSTSKVLLSMRLPLATVGKPSCLDEKPGVSSCWTWEISSCWCRISHCRVAQWDAANISKYGTKIRR